MFLRKKTVRLEIHNERLRDQLAALIASIEGFLVQSAHDTMPSDLLQSMDQIGEGGCARWIQLKGALETHDP